MYRIFSTLIFLLFTQQVFAQHLLGKVISIKLSNVRLADALAQISKEGGFQFSYRSDIVLQDKIVSIDEKNRTIKYLLDRLLEGNYHYSEKKKYVIIHNGGERVFEVSGLVQNGITGAGIPNATIYEEQILASTLSNEQGYFRLTIKNKQALSQLVLVVKKESYNEHVIRLNVGYDQELIVPIVPSKEIYLNDVIIKNEQTEHSWATRFFTSSKQKIQNINIGNFMANRPFQASLLPGFGSRGLIGSQVHNRFSFNIIGGYTGGVDGMEIGTVFNINKGNMNGLQVAGVFNNTNAAMNGVQIGSLYNYVSQDAYGVQVSGIANIVQGKANAIQIGGLSNLNLDTSTGIQLAGLANLYNTYAKGLSLAGLYNHCSKDARGMHFSGGANFINGKINGMQIAPFINYAHKISGVQFGLINIADSIDGVGIGLLNFYKNGKCQLHMSSSNMQQLHLGIATGTNTLYTLLGIGANVLASKQLYSCYFGLGTTIKILPKLTLNPECYGQVFYFGSPAYFPITGNVSLSACYQIYKSTQLFIAGNYSIAEDRKTGVVANYKEWLEGINIRYSTYNNNNLASWYGWQVGLRFF